MIVLFIGDSGTGKSTIIKKLNQKLDNVNIVKSYTTRPKRNRYDNDHTFIKSKDTINKKDVVASTEIDGHFYCALKNQFVDNKINLYTVDDKGLLDVKKYFKNEEIISIHINRSDISVPKNRKNRNIRKLDVKYDFEIFNDGNIDEAVNKVIECLKLYREKN